MAFGGGEEGRVRIPKRVLGLARSFNDVAMIPVGERFISFVDDPFLISLGRV